MSWQLGAFAILALGLAAGFVWYERSRPDARIVALVATLAAFAALGRIAFAALPNVKPTTDIVLISGYALGPAPGFVVGAVAGLTSNFFFGQGPWTPWQMAAWGVSGLIGAGLGAVTGRRLGRGPLAAVCTAVGFGFTAFQDLGDWVTYSDHSLAQLGVYVGKGLVFDAIHAGGCLMFALAFGPALARSVARFAERLQVSWRAPGQIVAPLVALGLIGWALLPAAGVARAAGDPAGYLLAAQNPDGGYGPAPGQPSSQLYSGWAALGLEADGHSPQTVVRDGHSLLGYIGSGAAAASDPGSLERTILVAAAAGADPTRFGGRNLVAALQADVGRDGSVSEQTNLTSFAVLALRAAGIAPPANMLSWLAHQQDADGGFNFATAGAASDVDDTGAALEALADDPAAAAVRQRAVGFLERQQNADGGFPASAGSASNAQSTAWAVQGLLAAGVSGGPVTRALSYLRSLIAPDGHVRYSRGEDQTPVWVTAEAAMALAEKPLPLAPPRPAGQLAAPPPRRHAAARRRRPSPHRARPHARRLAVRFVPSALSQRLAGELGVLDALALAPVGMG